MNAPSFAQVQLHVAEILHRKDLVVGHTLYKDFCNLEIEISKTKVRDISHWITGKTGNKMALKRMAQEHLLKCIQRGTHDPFVDALIALQLYYKKYWSRIYNGYTPPTCDVCGSEKHISFHCPNATESHRNATESHRYKRKR